MADYTVYLVKTDLPIAFGRAQECARMMGLASAGCFWSTLSRVLSGKNKKYIIVREEEQDERQRL